MEKGDVLTEARRIFKTGNWQETIDFLKKNSLILGNDGELTKAEIIKASSWYYLGIKGPTDQRIENLRKAENAFNKAFCQADYEKKDKLKFSALVGLSQVLPLLEKQEDAQTINDIIIKIRKKLVISNPTKMEDDVIELTL